MLHLAAAAGDSTAADDTRWWTALGDATLDSLVDVGLRNNYDMAIGISASYNKGQSSGMQSSPGTKAAGYGYWQAGVDMQWEIDVFGRIASQVRESKARVMVSRAERDGVELSLAAEIASTYVYLRVDQAQLKIAEEHLGRQQKALSIAQARFETGLASMMDVDEAQQVYSSTLASIPAIEYSITSEINTLATLLAVTPDSLTPLLAAGEIPEYIAIVPKTVDSSMLRQRPDVVQAEETVDINAEALGVTKKERLPQAQKATTQAICSAKTASPTALSPLCHGQFSKACHANMPPSRHGSQWKTPSTATT